MRHNKPEVTPARPGSDGEHGLQSRFGTETRAQRFYDDQVLDHLNDRMIEFIGRMDMAFIATADRHGECDASFRAGQPGFIAVLDPGTIAYPEYRGNGVLASLGNIYENPHVGILMVDFYRDLIGLHVNGSARMFDDELLRAAVPDLPVAEGRGRQPERWVVVDIEEAYIHCRKHIPRMMPADRERYWGTDDPITKGGDYFGAKAERVAERPAAGQVVAGQAADLVVAGRAPDRVAAGQPAGRVDRQPAAHQAPTAVLEPDPALEPTAMPEPTAVPEPTAALEPGAVPERRRRPWLRRLSGSGRSLPVEPRS